MLLQMAEFNSFLWPIFHLCVCVCVCVYIHIYIQSLGWNRSLVGIPGFKPQFGKIPWRRERLPTPVFWPGDLYGLYSSWVTKSQTWLNSTHQASLSITNSRSLLKLMSIESVMPFNHLILCCPLLLLPSIFPSIKVFSNESVPHIRWPKYWSLSFSISPSNKTIQDWFPLGWTSWISLMSRGLSRVFSNSTVQKNQLFSAQLSSQSNSHIHTWLLEKP